MEDRHDKVGEPVKEPLKLPFVFLFILLCMTVILAALDLFASWGLSDSASAPFGLSYVLGHLPGAALDVLIPSVVVSVVLIGFRMARRPFSRLLGFLIVLAAGYIVLVNGMIWLSVLAGKARSAPAAAERFLQPRTFVRLGNAIIAPAVVSDDALGGILVYEPGATLGARVAAGNVSAPPDSLTVYPAGRATSRGGNLTVTLLGQAGREVSGSPLVARTSVFAPDVVSALFLRDVTTITKDFQRLLQSALPEFFAASFALVFLCAASLVLLRLTRWPLVNIMLLMAAVRGYFLLYHSLAVSLAPAISAAVSDPVLVRLFPATSFIVLGIILLLVDVLFIPANRWMEGQEA